MPVLVRTIPVYLDELPEDGGSTSGAFDSKATGVVKVTKDFSGMLVVGVLRAKDCGTDGTCEMLDVKLHVWRVT
jgi:hypothetical protein